MVTIIRMTQSKTTRSYLSAAERRAEIADAAARIGIEEGLERITLRRVAESVGVRPGLISHYYPEAEGLVATAFVHATDDESDALFVHDETRAPVERMAGFLARAFSPESAELSRLWLNARNLSRYNGALRQALTAQETANRRRLMALVSEGVEAGEFRCDDIERSVILILILVDSLTAYANEERSDATPLVAPVVYATTERELGLAPGALGGHTAEVETRSDSTHSEAPAS